MKVTVRMLTGRSASKQDQNLYLLTDDDDDDVMMMVTTIMMIRGSCVPTECLAR